MDHAISLAGKLALFVAKASRRMCRAIHCSRINPT